MKDHHEESFKKLEELCKQMTELEISQQQEDEKQRGPRNFVIVL
jgi:hypothetical protein